MAMKKSLKNNKNTPLPSLKKKKVATITLLFVNIRKLRRYTIMAPIAFNKHCAGFDSLNINILI
jgi:hypothetical protein